MKQKGISQLSPKILFLITFPILIALAVYYNFSQMQDREDREADTETKEFLPVKINQKKLIDDLNKIARYEKKFQKTVFTGPKPAPVVPLPVKNKATPGDNIVFLKKMTFAQLNSEQLNALESIKDDVAKNKETYSKELLKQIEEASRNNDEKALSEIFAISSVLPLGPSPLAEESQRVIYSMSQGNQNWNEALFKNALQLFIIQSIYRSEDHSRFKEELMENADSDELKQNIEKIFTETELNVTEQAAE